MGRLEKAHGGAARTRRCVYFNCRRAYIKGYSPIHPVELAQLFRTRSASLQASSVLKKWRQVHQSHQNALSYAVHFDRMHLQYKMMLTWRLKLRAHLRMVKQAKVARKYLLLRRCLHLWTTKLQEKRRQNKLKEFEQRLTKKFFEGIFYVVYGTI